MQSNVGDTRKFPYDYTSVMHYAPKNGFAIDISKDTIVPLKPGAVIQRFRDRLSDNDVAEIRDVYQCGTPTPGAYSSVPVATTSTTSQNRLATSTPVATTRQSVRTTSTKAARSPVASLKSTTATRRVSSASSKTNVSRSFNAEAEYESVEDESVEAV